MNKNDQDYFDFLAKDNTDNEGIISVMAEANIKYYTDSLEKAIDAEWRKRFGIENNTV